ncbi:PREDICTED: calmodulin-lysine N-methyltransferase isoform X2 [Habropoda laboriosa]|uniref:calmodulin-lysine N-methyltransferase isoform X2 n=1 Tax=Habropoda laboriosa TaxID=597456 RepID=UPI00083D3FEF|nr:PREDICTED: calmodulin-lysine N-methyltransferase isoform X2 [Habropoda laboriosa]
MSEEKSNEIVEQKVTIGKKRNSTAQRRWRILAKALIGSQEPISIDTGGDEVSVRRFTSFNLLRVGRVENGTTEPEFATWYEYSTILENKLFTVQIRRLNKNFTASELIGFNNTGNICVWPSEECLAYYLLKNQQLCRNRRVLELGGGMSCLAGVIAAKYCQPRGVALTDGNVTSVNNVRCIVVRNGMADFVECGVVQWAKAARAIRRSLVFPRSHPHNTLRVKNWSNYEGGGEDGDSGNGKELGKLAGKLYDVILCADCLFFDEARSDLVETIYSWLSNDGIALVMAPRRGSTFQKFAEAAVKRDVQRTTFLHSSRISEKRRFIVVKSNTVYV